MEDGKETARKFGKFIYSTLIVFTIVSLLNCTIYIERNSECLKKCKEEEKKLISLIFRFNIRVELFLETLIFFP